METTLYGGLGQRTAPDVVFLKLSVKRIFSRFFRHHATHSRPPPFKCAAILSDFEIRLRSIKTGMESTEDAENESDGRTAARTQWVNAPDFQSLFFRVLSYIPWTLHRRIQVDGLYHLLPPQPTLLVGFHSG